MKCETKWINEFKGVAILGVLLVHFGRGEIKNNLFTSIVASGAKGVQIFFIISTYLIFMSLNKNQIHGVKSSLSWIWKKTLRLMPLYYLAIIIHLLVLGSENRYWLGSLPCISILNIISHFLFLHGLNPYYFNSIMDVEWYLGVLFLIYLIAPLLHKYIKNLSSSISVFLISLILCNYLPKLEHLKVIPDDYIWSHYITNYNLFAQFPVILLGIVLYFFLNSPMTTNQIGNKKVSYCILIFSVFVVYRLVNGSTFYGISQFGLWAIAFAGIIMSQILHPSIIICNKFFEFIGKYSYGIYLFHYLLIRKLPIIPINNIYLSWIVNYLKILALSLCLSIILNYCIERPLRKLLR